MSDRSSENDGDRNKASSLSLPSPAELAQRREARSPTRLRVRYRSLENFIEAYTRDISNGGVYVATTDFLPAGAAVKLELQLPDDGPLIAVIARVTHIIGVEEAKKHGREPGMGLRFLDYEGVPVARKVSEYLALRAVTSPETQERPPPSTVLVVDDSATQRQKLEGLLTNEGHRVLTASNGIEGLTMAVKHPPDLILSDVEMPTMDGWQLLRLLASRPALAGVPIVFLTSLDGEDDRLRGYRLGVDDYLSKDLGDQEVLARINRLLNRSKQEARAEEQSKALRGDLGHVPLASILAFVEMERRTGRLLVVSEREVATLHLAEGQLHRVDLSEEHDGLSGVARVFHVLGWTEGRFELLATEVPGDDEINTPITHLLMEHARRLDESSR